MYQRSDIKEGMTVRSVDGHKLGKVYAVGETEFHIEKGLFFPKDYSVRYAEISDLRNGEIILMHGKESLRAISDELPYGSDSIAMREGIGTGTVIHETTGTATTGRSVEMAELNTGEKTGLPFGSRPEDLRTQDLGTQGVGPYNTEGASASPFITEEDRARGIGTDVPLRRTRTTRRDVTDRPTLSASDEETMGARTVTDEDLEAERRVSETRSDGNLEGTRKLDFSPDDPNKRGI